MSLSDTDSTVPATPFAVDAELAIARLETLRPRLAYVSWKAGVAHQDVVDLVQDVLTTAVQQLRAGRFRGDSSLATWLDAILRNKIADYRERRQHVPVALGDHDAGLPEHERSAWHPSARPTQEVDVMVQQALALLPPLHRTVLLLNIVAGLTTAEIAQRLGRNANTLGKILWQAKPMLARALRGDTPTPPLLGPAPDEGRSAS